jgi:hypothetical protein
MNTIQTKIRRADNVMRFTHFSRHATRRVVQRTHLSNSELANVLDRKLVVHTGVEPGLPREHLLFYSQPDDNCFVAVRDTLTGKVVTVLPLEYHENLAWSISNAQVDKAKELFRKASAPATDAGKEEAAMALPSQPEPTKSTTTKIQPSSLVVSCTFLNPFGRVAVRVLCKLQASRYQNDIQKFMRDEGTPDLLDTSVQQKGIDPSRVLAVSVRIGNKSVPEVVVLNDQSWNESL